MTKNRYGELTVKEQLFGDIYFETQGNIHLAMKEAGYPTVDKENTKRHASMILARPRVRDHLRKLWEAAESPIVMSIRERKETLSEMARGDITDYVDKKGNVDLSELKHSVSIREVTVSDRYDKEGAMIRTTRIKLHNPVESISELNKMEKLYRTNEREGGGSVVNNYIITDASVIPKIERIGERTRPKLIEGTAKSTLLEGDSE